MYCPIIIITHLFWITLDISNKSSVELKSILFHVHETGFFLSPIWLWGAFCLPISICEVSFTPTPFSPVLSNWVTFESSLTKYWISFKISWATKWKSQFKIPQLLNVTPFLLLVVQSNSTPLERCLCLSWKAPFLEMVSFSLVFSISKWNNIKLSGLC